MWKRGRRSEFAVFRGWARAALLSALGVCLALSCGEPGPPGPGGGGEVLDAEQGKALFRKHCDSCHGEKGLGDGKAAYLLYPRPRDFSRGIFRIVTTENGISSDEDLLGVITRGMPGSAMPSWGHLSEAERNALVAEVRRLIRTSGAEALVQASRESGDSMSMEEALEFAGRPAGRRIELPPRPRVAATVARGLELYMERCASCHDEDGRGRKRLDMKDSFDFKIRARDFTAGIFKGGAESEDIAYRLLAGMPGTPMPKTELPGEELWPMVDHVRAAIRPGAQQRVEQKQTTISAARVDAAPELDPADPAWGEVSPTYLALMPLWWRDDRVEGVNLSAVHDGKTLVLRLTWRDPTRDESVVRQTGFTDAAAVQIATASSPPFFAMGEESGKVEIWHWKATWEVDAASGYQDVEGVFKRAAVDIYDSLGEPPYGRHSPVSEFPTSAHRPTTLPGWSAGNPLSDPERGSTGESLQASGFGTLTTEPDATRSLVAKGTYRDGAWSLLLARPLDIGKAGVALSPGGAVSVGLAIWDGSARDRDGQKSVTIWHKLVLAK